MSNTRTYFEKEIKAVVWEIDGFVSPEQFKEVGAETHILRSKNYTKKQLNNIQSMKVLSKEIQLWIDDVWFPAAKKSGLTHFAFVVPNDTFGKVSMDAVNKDAKAKYDINIEYFHDENKAKEWLISQ